MDPYAPHFPLEETVMIHKLYRRNIIRQLRKYAFNHSPF